MSSERSSKAPSELPDIDQLAALVDTSAPSPSERPSTGAPEVPASAGHQGEGVDETAPTDYYHAVKPKPKAVPITEVGSDDRPRVDQERPRRRVWAWLLAAFLLTGALAAAGVLHRGQQVGLVAPPQQQPTAVAGAVASQKLAGKRQASRAGPAGLERPSDLDDRTTSGRALADQRLAEADVAIPIRFERRGQAILVPVRLRGPSGAKSVKMVLDTGATFTTATTATLAAIGVQPTRVMAKVETANGLVSRPLALVDAIALDGATVGGGLTVGVCDTCAVAGTDGLLGLNFARHFVMTVDHDAGRLLLSPKSLADKTMDVRPFVTLLDARSERRGGNRVAIRFTIHNGAPRALHDLVIEATSSGLLTSARTAIAAIEAGARREATVEGLLVGQGGARTFTLELVRGSW